MKIFGSKKKALAEQPVEPDIRPRPAISGPVHLDLGLRRVRSSSRLAYLQDAQLRQAEIPPLPKLQSPFSGSLSSYQRAALPGDRPAVLPNAIYRGNTPPEVESDQDFADDNAYTTPRAAQSAPAEQDVYSGVVAERPRRAGPPGADPSRRQRSTSNAASQRLQSVTRPSPEYPPQRPATPPTPIQMRQLAQIDEVLPPAQTAPTRATPQPMGGSRPPMPPQQRSYQPPPFVIDGMRWHASPVQGQLGSYSVELRFSVRVGSEQSPS